MQIVNGRLEECKFTYHCLNRNRAFGSVVDYIITKADNFKHFSSVKVLGLSEFSDHCPIHFSMSCDNKSPQSTETEFINKIV